MMKPQPPLNKNTQFKAVLLIGSVLALVGCQSTAVHNNTPSQPHTPTVTKPNSPDGIKITPYDREEIKRESLQVIPPNTRASVQQFDDGRNLPAFKQLLSQTQIAFQQGQWDQAEQLALRAQRLAPQSAETFMYLAMIANQTHQAGNADALARRGLSYAQSTPMKRQLWQVILKSAQLRNNPITIQEAQARLKSL